MPELDTILAFLRNEIIVIPIIDVSGSMYGEKIFQVNDAMRDILVQLADINAEFTDSKLLIAPMEFSSGARWFALSNDQPAEVETFRWIDMKASGPTDMGAAFELLHQKLTTTERNGWMKSRGGAAPVLILISDGCPTDDYKTPLIKLQQRGWFDRAIKFGVAVGTDANKNVLAEFTGTSDAIIDTELFKTDFSSIVKNVVVTASKSAVEAKSHQEAIDHMKQSLYKL